MRLLNTQKLGLAEFFEANVPEYAILSHTWGDNEVTYQHIQSLGVARGMQGFAKIEGACRLAASEGFEYIWIDTCCIDKSSSAELSEAINSMYSWYQKSAKCYAYLADVNHLDFPNDTTEFEASRWFERGWTLQELIAPSQVVFLSHDWTSLGTKSELCGLISQITGIDIGTLSGADLRFVCVARKMFWASRRQTTRVEDMAYCLLGLFSVNMPLIYGEGTNSFIRLQEEIIKLYDDQSIFAWALPAEEHSPRKFYGLLAESPAAFKETGNEILPFPSKNSGRQPTRVMSAGLETDLLSQPPTYFFGLLRRSRNRVPHLILLFTFPSCALILALSSLYSLIPSPLGLTTFLFLLVLYFQLLLDLVQRWRISKRLIRLLTPYVSATYTRPLYSGAAVVLKWSYVARLIDYGKSWSEAIEDNHFRAVLDCQFIWSSAKSPGRPCLDIVALDSRSSTNHSSFARINAWKLETENLWSDIVPSKFKRGTSGTSTGAWSLSKYASTSLMQLFPIMRGNIPWAVRKVSVPHKPKEILPLGFLFHCVYNDNGYIHVIEASPTQQWFNHDNILRRTSLTMNSTLTNNGVPHTTEEFTTVTDGVVRLEISGIRSSWRFNESQALLETSESIRNVCLIVGLRHSYRHSHRDWVQRPWCRFITISPEDTLDGFMNITDGEDTTRISMASGVEVDARIQGLDSHGLYDVVLSLR